jgi:hypothetical protein
MTPYLNLSAFSSAKSHLIIEVYNDVTRFLSDSSASSFPSIDGKFLLLLSNQLGKCETTEDKQLRLLSLTILINLLSCNDDQLDKEHNLVVNSSHMQTSLERVLTLLISQEDTDTTNLCLFAIMSQSVSSLMKTNITEILKSLVVHMTCKPLSTSTAAMNGTDGKGQMLADSAIEPVVAYSAKAPVLACSALCTLLEQLPEEILSRHEMWSSSVSLLLIESFTTGLTDVSEQNSSGNSSSSSSSSINSGMESSNGDLMSELSLSNYSNPDVRLLPVRLSALRLLSRISPNGRHLLLPLALGSLPDAMKYIW